MSSLMRIAVLAFANCIVALALVGCIVPEGEAQESSKQYGEVPSASNVQNTSYPDLQFDAPAGGDTESQVSPPAPSPTPNTPPQSIDLGSVNSSVDSPATVHLSNTLGVPSSLTPSPGPATESSWWTFRIDGIKRSDEYTSTFPPVTVRPTEGHQLLQVSVIISNVSDRRQQGFFILRALWRDEVLKIIPFMPRGSSYPFPTGGYVEGVGPRKSGIISLEAAGDSNAEEQRYAMIEVPEEAATEDVILEILAADNPEVVELPVTEAARDSATTQAPVASPTPTPESTSAANVPIESENEDTSLNIPG